MGSLSTNIHSQPRKKKLPEWVGSVAEAGAIIGVVSGLIVYLMNNREPDGVGGSDKPKTSDTRPNEFPIQQNFQSPPDDDKANEFTLPPGLC